MKGPEQLTLASTGPADSLLHSESLRDRSAHPLKSPLASGLAPTLATSQINRWRGGGGEPWRIYFLSFVVCAKYLDLAHAGV